MELSPTLQGVSQEELKDLDLYGGADYFEALSNDIAATRAGDRVAIATMDIDPGDPLIAKVFAETGAAAERGAEVIFAVDAYTFMIDHNEMSFGPMWLPQPFRQGTYKKRMAALNRLEQSGARVAIINQPDRLLSNPHAGRSHLKYSVINNRVYLGGANFTMTERSDMFVSLEDAEVANYLFGVAGQLHEVGNTSEVFEGKDYRLPVDVQTDIYIDAGIKGQSAILDQTLALIDSANERVVGSFQYFPDREVSESLYEAHRRGADVKILYNSPAKYASNIPVALRETLAIMKQRRKMPDHSIAAKLPKQSSVLHSKALVTEKAGLVGSHNLVETGVRYGTSEIALIRRTPAFGRLVGELLLHQAQFDIYAKQPRGDVVPDAVPSFENFLTS